VSRRAGGMLLLDPFTLLALRRRHCRLRLRARYCRPGCPPPSRTSSLSALVAAFASSASPRHGDAILFGRFVVQFVPGSCSSPWSSSDSGLSLNSREGGRRTRGGTRRSRPPPAQAQALAPVDQETHRRRSQGSAKARRAMAAPAEGAKVRRTIWRAGGGGVDRAARGQRQRSGGSCAWIA